jgi:hypothetical protein
MLIQVGKHYINAQEILSIQYELLCGVDPCIVYKITMNGGACITISEQVFKEFKKNYTERYRVDVF